jgi:hypothetical protein
MDFVAQNKLMNNHPSFGRYFIGHRVYEKQDIKIEKVFASKFSQIPFCDTVDVKWIISAHIFLSFSGVTISATAVICF